MLFNPDPVRTLGFASILATYVKVGTTMTKPARMILVQNFTDANLMFSFDGTDDHFPVASEGFLVLDIATNKIDPGGFFISAGESLWVKEIENPTLGSVYFSVFYGADTHIA